MRKVFLIEDYVGETTKDVETRFHFHPDIHVYHDGIKNWGTIQLPSGSNIVWTFIEGSGRLEVSIWHPRFGVSVPNICLFVKLP